MARIELSEEQRRTLDRLRAASERLGLYFFDDAEADAIMPEGMLKETWDAIKEWFLDHAPKALGAALE